MKKIAKFLLAICCCGILSADVLKIGTSANYPPFEFIDENAKIAGFDIDLIEFLSKKIGFEYEFVNMSFDGLIPAIKIGKIDAIISAISATPDRKKAIDFTTPYYVTENLFIKRVNDASINDKNSLLDKKIGVQLGTVQEIAAREIQGAKVAPSKDVFAAIMGLKKNKIDVVLVDSSIGYGYLKQNRDLVEFLKEPDGSEGFSIAFDKDKQKNLIQKINAVMQNLQNEPKYEELLKKYDLK